MVQTSALQAQKRIFAIQAPHIRQGFVNLPIKVECAQTHAHMDCLDASQTLCCTIVVKN